MNRKHILAAVILVAAVGVGVAAGSGFFGTSDGNMHWDPPDGPQITTVDADIQNNVPQTQDRIDLGHVAFEGEGSATVRNFDSGQLVVEDITSTNLEIYSQSHQDVSVAGIDAIDIGTVDLSDETMEFDVIGTGTVDVHNLNPDTVYRVDYNDGSHSIETADAGGTLSVSVTDESFSVTERNDPVLTNPEPVGDSYNQRSVDLSVDLDHEDLGDRDSDVTVTLDWYLNGNHIATETTDEAGTYTANADDDLVTGDNDWSVEATDNVGDTDVASGSFSVPEYLQVRNEVNQSLITSTDIELDITFFGDEETVFTREVNESGYVDMSGLPVGQEFVVQTSENVEDSTNRTYHDRRIIVPSITQQRSIYLLPTNAESVDTEFVLDDSTGQFDGPDVKLIVEKPITEDNTTTYQHLAGDEIGADRRIATVLEQGERYQVYVDDGDGTIRKLGSYSAERSEQVELSIDDLQFEIGELEGGIKFDLRQFEEDGNEYVRFALNDTTGELNQLHLKIHPTNQPEETIYEDTIFEGEEIVVTEQIPEEHENVTSWTADWYDPTNPDRSGRTITGAGDYGVGLPGPVGLFSALLIVFVAGMFSVRVANVGAIVVPLVASGLWAVGWLPVPLTWVLASITLGVGAEFARRGGFSS